MAKDYTAATTANVISTAGDATLSIADTRPTPRPPGQRHVLAAVGGAGAGHQRGQPDGAFANVGSSAAPTPLLSWSGPVSNDAVTLDFKQSIGAGDALRTGSYSKTLTLTLSTTTP